MKSDEAIKKQDFADTLPRASVQDLGVILMGDGYEVRGIISSIFFFQVFDCLVLSLFVCLFSVGVYEGSFIVCFQGFGW